MPESELAIYLRLFRKWAWLVVGLGIFGSVLGLVLRYVLPATYESRTVISVGGYLQTPNPDYNDVLTGLELAQTYVELVKTYDLMARIIQRFSLPLTVEDMREDVVSATSLRNTSLVVVSVYYSDPVISRDMANAIAEELIAASATSLSPEQQQQVDLIHAQIDLLNGQLEQARRNLETVDARLLGETSFAPDASEIAALEAQRGQLRDEVFRASSTIAQFTATLANVQPQTNTLTVVETAQIAPEPYGLTPLTATLLGAFLGVAVGVGVTMVSGYLDDRLRTPDQAAELLALPVLGSVVRFGSPKATYADRLVTQADTAREVLENYREIRTNLLYATDGNHAKQYLITSPGPFEGKSLTSANLAVTMARAGLRILLVDADLRAPKLHEVFGLDNQAGLGDLLRLPLAERRKRAESPRSELPEQLDRCIQSTSVPNLWAITSGRGGDAAELLGETSFAPEAIKFWADVFGRISDVVIFDTPPCLLVADSSIIAAVTAAPVLLVVEAGRTRRGAVHQAKEQFAKVGNPIRGVILNKVNRRDEIYRSAYGYAYDRKNGAAETGPSDRAR